MDPNLVATVFVPTNDAFSKALSQYGVTPSQALQQASLIKGVSYATLTPACASTRLHPCDQKLSCCSIFALHDHMCVLIAYNSFVSTHE